MSDIPSNDPLDDSVLHNTGSVSSQHNRSNRSCKGWDRAYPLIVVVSLFVILIVLSATWVTHNTDTSRALVPQESLLQCALIASDAYEELSDTLVIDNLGPTTIYDDDQDVRRSMRAIQRADELLAAAWVCYGDLEGGEEGQIKIERERLVLADWYLLYESEDLDELRSDWYDAKITLNLVQ